MNYSARFHKALKSYIKDFKEREYLLQYVTPNDEVGAAQLQKIFYAPSSYLDIKVAKSLLNLFEDFMNYTDDLRYDRLPAIPMEENSYYALLKKVMTRLMQDQKDASCKDLLPSLDDIPGFTNILLDMFNLGFNYMYELNETLASEFGYDIYNDEDFDEFIMYKNKADELLNDTTQPPFNEDTKNKIIEFSNSFRNGYKSRIKDAKLKDKEEKGKQKKKEQ